MTESFVQVSQIYKNQLCGLCGNFDGQTTWEFEGPQRELYLNKTAFALSYVVPNSACPVSMTQSHLQKSYLFPIPKPMHHDLWVTQDICYLLFKRNIPKFLIISKQFDLKQFTKTTNLNTSTINHWLFWHSFFLFEIHLTIRTRN